jgi:hypothetical protein
MSQAAKSDLCVVKVQSMEHILTECEILGKIEIWDEGPRIWELKYNDWTKLQIGDIIAAASK